MSFILSETLAHIFSTHMCVHFVASRRARQKTKAPSTPRHRIAYGAYFCGVAINLFLSSHRRTFLHTLFILLLLRLTLSTTKQYFIGSFTILFAMFVSASAKADSKASRSCVSISSCRADEDYHPVGVGHCNQCLRCRMERGCSRY